MAIKASCSITLSSIIDVKGIYRYYLLQSSTLAKPSKPTSNPPTGWDDTEPTYAEGSTNTLYTVDITVFSDNTWISSEVSVSSSYEAAKLAYNKAVNAQASVTSLSESHAELQQTVDGLTSTVSGHTTLIAEKAGKSEVLSVTNQLSALEQNLDGFKTTVSSTYANRHDLYRYNLIDNSTDEWKTISIGSSVINVTSRDHASKYGLQAGDTITFSAELRVVTKAGLRVRMDFYSEVSGETGKTVFYGNTVSKDNMGISSVTATIPDNAEYIVLYITNPTTETSTTTEYYRKLKLEKGAYATEWIAPITSLIDIGGANYLSNSNINSSYATLKNGGTYYSSSTSTRQIILAQNLYLEPGTYTMSCYIKQLNGDGEPTNTQTRFRVLQNSTTTYYDSGATSGDWELCTVPLIVTSSSDKYTIYLRTYDSAGTNVEQIWIKKLKIERGTVATDWVPAYADIDARFVSLSTTIQQTASDLTVLIDDAAKTATSYLNYSASGLVVGNLTASTLGKNVLIDSDSVDIRNGTTTLASFGEDYLYLAKNSKNARIDLCNGLAQMYHETDSKGYSIFNIDTTYGLSYIKMSAPMHDLLVLENTNSTNGVIIKGMINGTTVGGFGLVRNGNMVRYGSDADDDNPVENVVLDTGNFLTEMDSGWQYTAGYGENFTQYNNEEYAKVRYRKIGGMVEIRGVMRPTTTIAGSTTLHELFTLGEAFRPATYLYHRCSGSYANTWLMTIAPSGRVSFSRYGSGNTYAAVDTSAWLPIHVTFMLD